MANNNLEIEIKVSVSEEEFNKIRDKLKEIAKFDKKIENEDEYFDLPHRSFLDCEYPFEWLSIRKRGGKNILNYKKLYPANTAEFTHADEFETEVSDADKLDRIFSLMDLKSLVVVKKIREIYNYNFGELNSNFQVGDSEAFNSPSSPPKKSIGFLGPKKFSERFFRNPRHKSEGFGDDEFEIALDYIEELGYFIEIEALKDFGGVEETRRKIFEFAEMIGMNVDNKVNRGYPYLLMKKRGLIK